MNTIIKIIITIFLIYLFYGVILNIIAKFLGALLALPNAILVAYKYRKQNSFISKFNEYNMKDALTTDISLHYEYRSLWNAVLSRGGYSFGNQKETLSSALGKKQVERTLTIVGWIIIIILFIIDYKNWFRGGHCIASINNNL